VLLEVPPSFKRPDGRWEHHIRQSDVGTFRKCPELRRVDMLGLVVDITNDTAGIGTAVHEGIRYVLDQLKAGNEPEFDDALEIAIKTWHTIWHDPNINVIEVATLESGGLMVESCLVRWWNEVLPDIWDKEILAVELPFDVKLTEDDKRIIFISGTSDLWLPFDIWDWKTANKKYSGRDGWKYERSYWSVQHTLYAVARYILEGGTWTELADEEARDKEDKLTPFHYVIIPREPNGSSIPDVDKLTITSTVGDARFLYKEMLSIAKLIEAELDQWPLGPTDWWCSNKWCANWDNCRGAFHKEDPWTLVERANAKLEKKRTRASGNRKAK
jgi:hypothetical protein